MTSLQVKTKWLFLRIIKWAANFRTDSYNTWLLRDAYEIRDIHINEYLKMKMKLR